jgi:hypothetical protein
LIFWRISRVEKYKKSEIRGIFAGKTLHFGRLLPVTSQQNWEKSGNRCAEREKTFDNPV